MGMSKGNLKRMDKMIKDLAEESVPPGEALIFFDLGAIETAEETLRAAKKGLAKTYAVGIASAGLGVATGADPTMMRDSTNRYAAEQFQSEQYVTVVTDKQIRIINVEQKSGAFSLKWARIKGTEDIVLSRDGLTIETGELSKGSMMGMKYTSLPVTFKLENGDSFTLHYYKEDEWAGL